MTTGKREPPFSLDIDFFKALELFAGTVPTDVDESIERAKQKKPPEDVPRQQVLKSASKSSSRKR